MFTARKFCALIPIVLIGCDDSDRREPLYVKPNVICVLDGDEAVVSVNLGSEREVTLINPESGQSLVLNESCTVKQSVCPGVSTYQVVVRDNVVATCEVELTEPTVRACIQRVEICYKGKTKLVPWFKVDKWLARGATLGPCEEEKPCEYGPLEIYTED